MSLRLNALFTIIRKAGLFTASLGLISAWAYFPNYNLLYTFESGSTQGFNYHASGSTSTGYTPTKSFSSPATTVATVGKSCCLFSYGIEDEYIDNVPRPARFTGYFRVNSMGTGLNPGMNAYSYSGGETKLNADGTEVSQFTLEFAEKYGGNLYLTGGLMVKTYAGQNQVFLNDETTPTYFPGISSIQNGKWYKVTVTFDYNNNLTSWYINEIEGETAPVVKSFQGGRVFGVVKIMMSGSGNNDGNYIDAEIDNVSITYSPNAPAPIFPRLYQINGFEPLHIQDSYTQVDRVVYGNDENGDIVFPQIFVSPGIFKVYPEPLNCYDFAPTETNFSLDYSGYSPYNIATRKSCTRPIGGYISTVGGGIPVNAYNAGTSTLVASTTTDAGGNFSFNVSPGSYDIKPVNACFEFFPYPATITTSYYDKSTYSIEAWSKACTVTLSGTVSGVGSGSPVTIRDASNNVVANLTTNSSGFYSTSLAPGTYTITPVGSCYNFSPASRTVTFNHFGSSGNNFSGALKSYTLTVNAPNGNVTPGSGSYACSATPTTVNLTASNPNGRYVFSNWSGDASGTSTTASVTMNANRTVTANYTGPYYSLTANATTGGTVSKPPGITVLGANYYLNTSSVTVNASAATNYKFTAWSGASTATTPSVSIATNADKTITGNFSFIVYSLSVTCNNCTASPSSGSYNSGSSVQINVTPASGYVFSSWSDGVTTASRTVTMNANTTLTATCSAIPTYTVTTNVTPTGGGTISLSPTGPNYQSGTPVTVTANPNTANGYHFVNWTGDLSGTSASGSLTMNANKSVTANFALNVYTLTATTTNGTVSPSTGSYTHGTPVTVTVTPAAGYEFSSWSDGITTPSRTVTMTSNLTLSATCTLIPSYSLTVNVSPTGGGTVKTTPTGPSYLRGTAVGVKATPNAANGYHFVNWTGDQTGTADSISVIMNANKVITANFALNTYTLTATTTNGTVSPSTGTYTHGTPVTVTVTPASGYEFSSWSDGITTPSRTVTMTSNVTLSSTCTLIPSYTLTVTIAPTAGGSVDLAPLGGTYVRGTPVTLTAKFNTGYTFLNWSGAATGTNPTTTVTMNSNLAVTANFKPNKVNLKLSYLNGIINYSPLLSQFDYGSTVTLTPLADPNYVFDHWLGGATGTAPSYNLIMNGDQSVEAVFRLKQFAVTTAVTPAGAGTVSPALNGALYDYGSPLHLSITENAGYKFQKWSGDATQSYSPIDVVIDKAKTFTAVFTPAKVRLTITTPVNGAIDASPKPDANGFYNWGTPVHLTAKPTTTPWPGYKLTAWGGAASGSSVTTTVIMDGDKTVSATFAPKVFYTLTLTPNANGTLEASPKPMSGSFTGYLEGTTVTLKAKAGPGYYFASWGGAAVGTTTTTSVIMDANKTASAVFTTAPPVILTVVVGTATTQYTIAQNTSQPISAIVPANQSFVKWAVTAKQNGKVAVNIANPTSPTTASVKLAGGNATVSAVFADPKLQIATYEGASGGADLYKSKPKVRLHSLNAVAMTNFSFRYYFKVGCENHPIKNAWAPAGWSATIEDADGGGDQGGNFDVLFTYTGTWDGRTDLATPDGLELSYSCSECSGWNRVKDPSGPHRSGKWVDTRYVPVYFTSDLTRPIPGGGIVPPLEINPPAAQPPAEGAVTFFIPPPITLPEPMPNLTIDQAFAQGNFLANGAFEMDTLGWFKYGGTGIAWNLMPHSLKAGAFDGDWYMQVKPSGSDAEGIYFEIPETSPAYNFLLGKTVTISARVRKPSETVGSLSVRLTMLNGTDNGSSDPSCAVDETWGFCTNTIPNLSGTLDGGIKKLRFSIVEASPTQNLAFDVDGVSLTLGEKAAPAVVKTKLTSSRHTILQERTYLPSENFGYDPDGQRLVITNTENDALGRLKKSYLPVVKDCSGDDCNPFYDTASFRAQRDDANRQYTATNTEGLPDAGGYAYSEPQFEQDQTSATIKTGAPGANFNLASGHVLQKKYSGVNTLAVQDLGTDPAQPANKNMPTYAYSYTTDQNGNGRMEWKNGFGQVVRTAAKVTDANGLQTMVTDKVYDARGNLVVDIPPASCYDRAGNATHIANCVDPDTMKYDLEDHVSKIISADEDTAAYFYDYMGRTRISQNAAQRAANTYSITRYDVSGRIEVVGEYHDNDGFLSTDEFIQDKARDRFWPLDTDPNFIARSIYFYDKMPSPVLAQYANKNPGFKIYPIELDNTFKFTNGKLCAVVTLQQPVEALNPIDAASVNPISSVAYRYDKYGRIIETYSYNGFIPNISYRLQKVVSIFDVSGHLIESQNFDSANQVSPTRIVRLAYDPEDRLKEVKDGNGKSVARYTYFHNNGKIKTIVLDGSDPDSVLISYTYHIQGGIKQITTERPILGASKTLYAENLSYEQPTAPGSIPRYNGNISQIQYFLSQLTIPGDGQRQTLFAYDEINRLKSVAYEVLDATTNAKDNEFDAAYGYDIDGRITFQRTGSKAASTVSSGGEYNYLPGMNRLAFVANGMGDGSSPNRSGTLTDPAYQYDQSGRITSDRSKGLSVEYDFRGLPISFTYKDGLGSLHQMVVRYDQSGNRISKMDFLQGQQTPSEYIVDANSGRERDYATVNAAYDALSVLVSGLNGFTGKIFIYQVYDKAPATALTVRGTSLKHFFLKDGIHSVAVGIRTVQWNSEEYWSLVASRKIMSYAAGTHYTGVGNEIRHLGSDPATVPAVYTDLPFGLGRFAQGSSEKLLYVQDHLGSLRLAIPTDASQAGYDAYDYFAFGKQLKLVNAHTGTDKITQSFTGKEYDELIGLSYFGARYLDQDLGLWISPDPGKQFHSPYSYSSDPVNLYDPDGRAVIGAVVGGAVASLTTLRSVYANDNLSYTQKVILVGGAGAIGTIMGLIDPTEGIASLPATIAIVAGLEGLAGAAPTVAEKVMTKGFDPNNYSASDAADVGLDFGIAAFTGGLFKGASAGLIKSGIDGLGKGGAKALASTPEGVKALTEKGLSAAKAAVDLKVDDMKHQAND
jgi:RHS repeat-associated protein/uncharacterized repeat protein (TIGR02543 family)